MVFNNKTGFISREWFPYFANARRDGYDFDAAWDDGLVQRRYKAIMDLCEDGGMHPGFELKPAAGFGKEGYKNFDGCIAQLQMQMYLIIRKFERRRNKRGQTYGMAVSYYQKPEALWGYEHVTGAYKEEPSDSAERILHKAVITEAYFVTHVRAGFYFAHSFSLPKSRAFCVRD